MTKADLVEQVAEAIGPGITKKDCALVVDGFLGALRQALAQGENIEIRGFGTFKVRKRKSRMARNPRTGDAVEVLTIMPVGADPHDFQASAQQANTMRTADALIVNGADFEEGLIDAPSLFQLCMGIPYGAPADPGVLAAEVNLLPEGANFASFAIGRDQLPWVAQSVLAGGHARVGLEDNLYLSRGVKATNEQLTERAVEIVQNLGASVATPDRAREILGLKERTGA